MNILVIKSEIETLKRFSFIPKVINLYLILYANKLNVSQIANNELLWLSLNLSTLFKLA